MFDLTLSYECLHKVGDTALMNAIALDYTEMVRLLLDKGANMEVAGEVTPSSIGDMDASISLISEEGSFVCPP